MRVQTNEDADFDDETFTLTATKVSGATANTVDAGTATINDDDTPPVVSISNGTTTAALADAGSVTLAAATEGNFVYFDLTLSSPAGTTTVHLATLDNDAGGSGKPRRQQQRRRMATTSTPPSNTATTAAGAGVAADRRGRRRSSPARAS